jgi:hypothetical protein
MSQTRRLAAILAADVAGIRMILGCRPRNPSRLRAASDFE